MEIGCASMWIWWNDVNWIGGANSETMSCITNLAPVPIDVHTHQPNDRKPSHMVCDNKFQRNLHLQNTNHLESKKNNQFFHNHLDYQGKLKVC
jgi:hypothetical protein